MTYKLGSLFDGSGGFPLAGTLCGIEPVWASEVEPYPIAVTKSRFPKMKHLGDISKIKGAEIEPVDIITFGSPCQDLSVAGKRAGLKHEVNGDAETTRSGLFIEAVRIIKEMREKTNGILPRFAIWENVLGAFSSNKGQDFRVVLEELIKVAEPSAVMPEVPPKGWAYADCYSGDGWSLAYRVLDAQYWGVPQRRRRIYLVADFRGGCAKEILFEREGLRGYFTEGRNPWQTASTDAQRSTRTDDREGEIPYTLKIRSGVSVDSYGKGAGKGALIQKNKSATLGVSQDQYLFQPIAVATQQGGAEITENGICPTITAAAGMSGNNQPWICQGLDAYNQALTGAKSKTLNSAATDADHVPCTVYSVDQGDKSPIPLNTLSITHGSGGDLRRGDGIGKPGAPQFTISCGHPHAVAYSFDPGASRDVGTLFIEECGKTLTNGTCPGHHDGVVIHKKPHYIVRRLTPTECARLQGFADRHGDIEEKKDFTDEEYKFWLEVRNTHARINGKKEADYNKKQMLTWYNKLHTDSSEYKMWGNGIALPTALYVMQGIEDALSWAEFME